ncbi:hypothetical protein MUK42_02812 [Musa troglodytarum]|uniref:Uncharacterized protein n=1 Tax=Musa troglodytarum TaxID=320322 RepID=A0A9E7IAS0_9LILI|nr:hypothetical protein MUK42_02812 [Musa troglodytarum]
MVFLSAACDIMEKILERYERDCYAEKALTYSEPEFQHQVMLDSITELQRKGMVERVVAVADIHGAVTGANRLIALVV